MNFLKNIFHSISIALVSFGVFWIITGSTIEFHQKYVYHQFVDLWQTQVAQVGKDIKKTFKLYAKSNLDSNGNDSFIPNQNQVSKFAVLNLSRKNIYSRYLFDLITAEYHSVNVLRGPPACA
ncbi:MAG TPA: hypothetical protein P5514_10120 [Bacteroidales bacterium]|nr:hypothetical protein [Bacteroidales bacterium]HRX97289.1 hypothetical protein [Bacteroidales bacterium]